MISYSRLGSRFAVLVLNILGICLALAFGGQSFARPAKTTPRDPWAKTQLILPRELARLLSHPGSKKPLVVYVGFEFLYKGAHIAGAQYIAPGREAKGIEALKTWARGIPHHSDIVLYCGCCPFKECPNIRPAFQALRELGFTRLKVLYLEESFAKDWMEKGFPVEKSVGKK